ncbi:hypothetical protein [Thiocapsa sp. UBA6158]|jgi:hypothetical protein|uniref:hypothetical protein n=1 Tax=Thiocapsa sp. UBA6158 TaxID=1947692 RepID=UPI0025ED879C|nr:hypothetical protein [Thiocapsa sp. UBA6158]
MNPYQDERRVGGVILAHRQELRDTTAAIYSAASLLRDVLTEQSVSDTDEWPETWDANRLDAVLALIEAAGKSLYLRVVSAVGEGQE